MTTSKTQTAEHTRRWLVWLDEYGDSHPSEVWTSQIWPPHRIAEGFMGEHEDRCCDYRVASGGCAIVNVKDDHDVVHSFEVYGEPIPVYRSRAALRKRGAL